MKLSEGKFQADLNEIEKLLNNIEILEERNHYPSRDFDPAIYRSKNYIENWSSAITENIYNFLLSDNSILYFKFVQSSMKISYTYFECPYMCLSYDEFLEEFEREDAQNEKIFQDEYDEYLLQCQIKEHPVMVRYDFDINAYYEGLHPISHIHIGSKNNIRIGIQKMLTPKAFLHFVLRQHYSSYWLQLIGKDDQWKRAYLTEKSLLADIDKKFWKNLDTAEFHF